MQKGWREKLSSVDITYANYKDKHLLLAIARNFLKEEEILLDFTVTLLQRKDIDVNIKDDLGWTALAYAARYHGTETRFIELLLKHPDIDVNCQDNDGWTPLMNACRYVVQGDSSFAIVKMLLNCRNINPNIQTSQGKSALFFSARYADIETYKGVLYHRATTTLLNDNTSVEHLIQFCRDSPDFSKKVFFAMKCEKMNFANLWVHAYMVGATSRVGKDCLSVLCNVLKHDRINSLSVPSLKQPQLDSGSKIFKNILTGIRQCASLRHVHFMDPTYHRGMGADTYYNVFFSYSITKITKDVVSPYFPLSESNFLLCNKAAHKKCSDATVFVFLAFRKLLNSRDLARMIAKLIWASDGTRVWHEEGYISLGEDQEKKRLCREIATQ